MTYFCADAYETQVAQAKCGKCEATEIGKNDQDQRDGGVCEADAGWMGGYWRQWLGGCEINVCGLYGCNGEAKQAQSN